MNDGRFNLIVVSYSIDDTIIEVMDYLRSYGMLIRGLEFKYFEDDEKEYFVTRWIGEEEVEEIGSKELTPAQRRNMEFFGELLEDFKSRNPGVTYKKPSKNNWLRIPAAHSDVHFQWSIRKDWVEVGFHIESRDREWNMKMLEFLRSKKSYLEEKVGEELKFEEWGKSWARVYAKRERGNLDEEVKNWMKEKMNAFYRAVKPLVDEYLK